MHLSKGHAIYVMRMPWAAILNFVMDTTVLNLNVKEGQRHVPNIICIDPYNKTVYIIDVRIAWTISTSGGGDGEYYTGKLAKEAEDFKRSDGAGWGHCVKHHQDFKAGAKFVPFGVEISGELGPAAQ